MKGGELSMTSKATIEPFCDGAAHAVAGSRMPPHGHEPALRLNDLSLSIAAVERDTGLSKDTLRVWERRYGFPAPQRDASGERAYSLAEVEKLRVVKRLLDVGPPSRPHRAAGPAERCRQLTEQTLDPPLRATSPSTVSTDLRTCLALVRGHDIAALRAELAHALARLGVARFVLDSRRPARRRRGRGLAARADGGLRGTRLHRGRAGGAAPGHRRHPRRRPRRAARCVLLSTLPGEPHGLGLLMAEALLALEGCRCVSLGVQTPLWDLVLAAAPTAPTSWRSASPGA